VRFRALPGGASLTQAYTIGAWHQLPRQEGLSLSHPQPPVFTCRLADCIVRFRALPGGASLTQAYTIGAWHQLPRQSGPFAITSATTC